ncbi:vomeronasal type-2 receptor 116-like [Pelobates fuscus]|uniref:vomeronasal type-2 receptor 116-like n=1 Tax=Pelobates fuscus TaxID=191477 RepID=UPI002FE4D85E
MENLFQLMVMGQFFNGIPPHLQNWVRDRKPQTLQGAAKLADEFLETRRDQRTQNQTVYNPTLTIPAVTTPIQPRPGVSQNTYTPGTLHIPQFAVTPATSKGISNETVRTIDPGPAGIMQHQATEQLYTVCMRNSMEHLRPSLQGKNRWGRCIREVPQELLFGRRVKGTLDLIQEHWEEEETINSTPIVPYVLEFRDRLEVLTQTVRDNLQVAQQRQRRWPLLQYYKYVLTFRFAIEEINRNVNILPNITLGLHMYDSCSDGPNAVKSILKILSGPGKSVPNYHCRGRGQIVGFIGDHSSVTTLPMAQILGVYRYTQISYGATHDVLNDRYLYPTFFRTLQSDNTSYSVLSKLLKHFGWTWVGILASDDDSGEKETLVLTKHMTSNGICVAFKIKINFVLLRDTDRVLESYRNIVKESTANIIVICGTFSPYVADFFRETGDIFADRTLILNPTFAVNNVLLEFYPKTFNGSLALEHLPIQMPDMKTFFESFHPLNHPDDCFLKHLWLLHFRCDVGDQSWHVLKDIYKISLHNCTGKERLTDFSNFAPDGLSPRVYHAVHAMTEGLQQINLFLNRKKHMPRSQCSENCLPGSRKIPKPGIHSCCFDCVQCSEGEISNITDSENCRKCPNHEWPNEEKVQCVPKQVEFLSYSNDVLSLVFSSVSSIFLLLTALILGIFIFYQNTPIVKANNKTLSFILLFSIMLSFFCVFLFIGRPLDITCMLRQTSFGVIFSVGVSSVLAKTIMVCAAFRATKPDSVWKTWIGVKLSNIIVLFCSSVQVVVSISWLAICPPFQELDTQSYKGRIIIQCNEGSVIAFYLELGYMGILAAISFVLAFMVRTLPDSFNEAKYITFSMLVFCSVWIAMIPAYLSTKGKDMVAVEIFAILASSAGLLGCIFLPKCYIILCRSEINTKSYLFENKKVTI